MAETPLTAKRVDTFLKHLAALADSLPTKDQIDEVERELDRVMAFLADFKARLITLPTREDEASLQESLKVLRQFILIAEADPLISKTLGLQPKQAKARSRPARTKTRPDVATIIDDLRGSPTNEIRTSFSERVNGCTVADLKQIAASIGLRVGSKTTKSAIIEQIAKQAENEAGYAYLREHA